MWKLLAVSLWIVEGACCILCCLACGWSPREELHTHHWWLSHGAEGQRWWITTCIFSEVQRTHHPQNVLNHDSTMGLKKILLPQLHVHRLTLFSKFCNQVDHAPDAGSPAPWTFWDLPPSWCFSAAEWSGSCRNRHKYGQAAGQNLNFTHCILYSSEGRTRYSPWMGPWQAECSVNLQSIHRAVLERIKYSV